MTDGTTSNPYKNALTVLLGLAVFLATSAAGFGIARAGKNLGMLEVFAHTVAGISVIGGGALLAIYLITWGSEVQSET